MVWSLTEGDGKLPMPKPAAEVVNLEGDDAFPEDKESKGAWWLLADGWKPSDRDGLEGIEMGTDEAVDGKKL